MIQRTNHRRTQILVTGATGYLGSTIVSALRRAQGHDVVEVVRSPESDIARPETLAPLVAEADAVIHAAIDSSGDAAATDRRFVESVIAMLGASKGLRRFVYTSGLWVLGDTRGGIADENTPPNDPAKAVAWRPAVERMVLEATARGEIEGWVVRPAITYGGTGGLVGMIVDSFRREGAARIVGHGDNHWPLIHRDDLGDLYARVLELAPTQRILHATDGSAMSLRSIAEAVARALGDERAVVSMPIDEARKAMGPLADALALDQRVASEITRRALGFVPRRSLVESLASLATEKERFVGLADLRHHDDAPVPGNA